MSESENISNLGNNKSQANSKLGLSAQQIALAQAMGLDLYQSQVTIDVRQVAWLSDLCNLLDIQLNDCIFDVQTPHFNHVEKKLHLPKVSYTSELALKKVIWQHVRPWAFLA